jgi:hypothetical protein
MENTIFEQSNHSIKEHVWIMEERQNTEKYWRDKIADDISLISLSEDNNQLNALGMRMVAEKVARGVL